MSQINEAVAKLRQNKVHYRIVLVNDLRKHQPIRNHGQTSLGLYLGNGCEIGTVKQTPSCWLYLSCVAYMINTLVLCLRCRWFEQEVPKNLVLTPGRITDPKSGVGLTDNARSG